ncbi:hypothetical protein AB8E32_18400 [Marinomonas polaris]|uniref:hypothetical protein n=1 Tax=Marinomonas polaris TaxID=293552 RepID=UPI003517A341
MDMMWISILLAFAIIPVPLWIPQLPVAIGMIALNLAILDALITVLRGKKPTYSEQEDALSLEEI